VDRLAANVDLDKECDVTALGDRHRRHAVRRAFGIAGQHDVRFHPLCHRGESLAEPRAAYLLGAFPDDDDGAWYSA
jgi:hypothetical protein